VERWRNANLGRVCAKLRLDTSTARTFPAWVFTSNRRRIARTISATVMGWLARMTVTTIDVSLSLSAGFMAFRV